ncbi:MAG: hypothetical protein JNM95_03820 [Chitinophagaceae bacterium]|nr:hypothetical protein [Chitinophagaceae bacterium]
MIHNRFLLVALLNLICWLELKANPVIVWDNTKQTLDIAKKIFVYEEKEGPVTIERISDTSFNKNFKQATQPVLNLFNDSYCWIKFDLENRASQELVLELAQPGIELVECYAYDIDHATWTQRKSGFSIPLKQHYLKHPYPLFPIAPGRFQYYLRFQFVGLGVPVKLWQHDAYEQHITQQKMFFGVFTGLMGFVILINLFFFFSLRKRAYIHYAVLVSFYYLIACNVEGAILYFFSPTNTIYGLNIWSILACPVGISYVMFFLETKKYTPRLHKICIGLFFYYLSYVFWHRYLTPLQLVFITDLNGLGIVLIMTTMGIQTGRHGNKMGYYYFSGYLIFFIFAIIDSVNRFTGFPPSVFGILYISLGFLTEAFMLAYLLTKRFEWEKESNDQERLKTQNLLLDKTKENERMIREQNIMLEKKVQERTEELLLEKKKSDDLLLNTLPADVAEELRQTGITKARQFDSVTIMFTDFVNFTGLSTQMTAADLVAEIHENFTAFDAIIEKHGLEKIKTIGDAYLAVCGLPNVREDHALCVIRAAMEIRDYVKKRNGKFQVRIGINSGPVVAGIVGVKKYAYDIWGDTVNTANRMETHGEEGRINLSESTYHLIKTVFRCESRGKFQVKGKGEIDMYFLSE